MRQYQTSIGSNGYQNLLFPLEYMYISQGEGGSYSHEGTYNIDFLGYGANGRVYHCPYYAPCDVICYNVTPSGVMWNSINKVNFVDGTIDYISLNVVHDDNNTDHYVGEIIRQGDLLGRTGTKGDATGDHVHMNVALGQNQPLYQNSYGHYMLRNSVHLYNAMGVNDTNIIVSGGYTWKDFTNWHPRSRRSHFKFFLYDKRKY